MCIEVGGRACAKLCILFLTVRFSVYLWQYNLRFIKILRRLAKMAKRVYIPVSANGRKYKLYMDDVHKVHTINKARKPPVPSYDDVESPRHMDLCMDVEFEPLSLL